MLWHHQKWAWKSLIDVQHNNITILQYAGLHMFVLWVLFSLYSVLVDPFCFHILSCVCVPPIKKTMYWLIVHHTRFPILTKICLSRSIHQRTNEVVYKLNYLTIPSIHNRPKDLINRTRRNNKPIPKVPQD